MYINFGAIRFRTAKRIERIAQKKLANVHAFGVEYCFIARKPMIQITNKITTKNAPSAVVLTKLKNSKIPFVSFIVAGV